MNSLLVGCPIYERGWVLDAWFDHIEQWHEGIPNISYVFAYTPGLDDTYDVIARRGCRATVIEVYDGFHSTNRDWNNVDRVRTMADTRNRLMKWVRHLMYVNGTAAFLSLDSDVLVPSWSEAEPLVDGLRNWAAVSPLVYLGRGNTTNVFTEKGSVYRRVSTVPSGGKASILCAAVLMGRSLAVDETVKYQPHVRGEDFGWSESATENGYSLGYDFTVKCKHIMEREDMDVIDRRIGW